MLKGRSVPEHACPSRTIARLRCSQRRRGHRGISRPCRKLDLLGWVQLIHTPPPVLLPPSTCSLCHATIPACPLVISPASLYRMNIQRNRWEYAHLKQNKRNCCHVSLKIIGVLWRTRKRQQCGAQKNPEDISENINSLRGLISVYSMAIFLCLPLTCTFELHPTDITFSCLIIKYRFPSACLFAITFSHSEWLLSDHGDGRGDPTVPPVKKRMDGTVFLWAEERLKLSAGSVRLLED